jgi:predicted nucleic-acid-binding Zn-ribbon protein
MKPVNIDCPKCGAHSVVEEMYDPPFVSWIYVRENPYTRWRCLKCDWKKRA